MPAHTTTLTLPANLISFSPKSVQDNPQTTLLAGAGCCNCDEHDDRSPLLVGLNVKMKDPEIKLFGKKIVLPEIGGIIPISVNSGGDDSAGEFGIAVVHSGGDRSLLRAENCSEGDEVSRAGEERAEDEEKHEVDEDHPAGEPIEVDEELTDPEVLPHSDDNPRTPSIDEESAITKTPKAENDQSDMNNSQQKTLKKPDKILPCPRCNSMDTKFCYYNNYNVNQPRHFCKSCQRYWTAGGTMRNVPVGAGRRKSKNTASHCRHITISEALQAARLDASNGIHHPALKTNGTVLSFGSDSPLSESMASILNIAEKKAPNGVRNGFYKIEAGMPVSCKGGENCEDCSSGSSITTSGSMVEGEKNGHQKPVVQNIHSFPSQIPCLPGVPWPCPWNSAVPLPAICPPGFPMPIFPAPYWNCSIPGAWSIPWLSPLSPPTNQKAPVVGPNSPTLGKHTRNGELLKPTNPEGKEPQEHNNSERTVLVPKTLRIDDPDEAAKSSIWATLGIKNGSISKGGLFKPFQSKGDGKNHIVTTSPVLQANPAALSRSLTFQESA